MKFKKSYFFWIAKFNQQNAFHTHLDCSIQFKNVFSFFNLSTFLF